MNSCIQIRYMKSDLLKQKISSKENGPNICHSDMYCSTCTMSITSIHSFAVVHSVTMMDSQSDISDSDGFAPSQNCGDTNENS